MLAIEFTAPCTRGKRSVDRAPFSFKVANLANIINYPSTANFKDTFLTSATFAFGPDLEVALPLPRLGLLWLQSHSWLGLHPLEGAGAASRGLTSLDASSLPFLFFQSPIGYLKALRA